MAPEVISGRYRVKDAIGRGGMGTVWRCSDEVLGRDVAVKQVGLLPHESTTDSARALREARSAANLHHKNVVSVFDVLDTEGAIWIVMEYVPSRTLGQVIREDGPLSPERVARIGAQVADGLAAAHAAGTIHRDVKPDNILLTADGVAKIGDFGIARMAGDQALTQSGFVTGTPSYFSPELAEGGDPGPAADVWALGATLHTAVEGSPPYPSQPNPVAMLRTIAAEPPAPRQRAGFLEPALARMLDRDPGSRWAMPDAAHALRRLADRHEPGRTREATAAFPVPPRAAGAPAAPEAATAPAAAGAATAAGAAGARRPASDRPDDGAPGPAARSSATHSGPVLPDRGTGRDGRRRRALPLLAAVAVLLLVAGLGYLLLGLGDHDGGRDAAGASRSPSPDDTSASPSPSKSATSSPSSTSAGSGPASGKGAMTRFLRGYYGTVPDDLDAGWSQLGPHERAQGRASYQDFWGGVDSVDVSRIRPDVAGSSAEVTLTYHFSDGRVVVERQRLGLVRSSDGSYLIDSDDVLSSRTVRG